jgi:TIR domain/FtsX-like permease family
MLAAIGKIYVALVLVLAALGLLGLLLFFVSSREREIAIRVALGAERRNIRSLIVREAALLTGAGMLVGLPASYLMIRSFSALVYGVSPALAGPVLGALAVLGTVAVLAALVQCIAPAVSRPKRPCERINRAARVLMKAYNTSRANRFLMRVYISGGKSSARIASYLTKALRHKGFEIAPQFQSGEDIQARLLPLIREADAFIVVVGERDERSEWLEREWFEILEQTSDRTKNLIPLVLGKAEPPNFLKNWQALRLSLPAGGAQLDELVDTIANLIEKKEIRLATPGKADLAARERRLNAIEATARRLKSLGM